MKSVKLGVLAAVLAVGAMGAPALAQPDLGAPPLYSEMDYFSADNWGMTVYSYVFDHTAPPPAEFGQMLEPGEFLFAYFLDGDDSMTVSVESFSVGNPYEAMIPIVGYESGIVPAGYVAGNYQSPFIFGYSGTAQASIFTYFDMLDPFATLEPTEWSLVWYVALAEDWGFVPATASGGGIGDNQIVPGPIPAPGALALLGLAGLLRRRRRG